MLAEYMLRHEALRDLSRDHFFVLVQCQRIRKAVEGGATQEEIQALARSFLAFLEREGEPHFHEEDHLLTPRVKGRLGPDEDAVLGRVAEDHAWIRDRADALRRSLQSGQDVGAALGEVGRRLAAHARFEEDTWFPLVQDSLDPSELNDYHAASQGFRIASRGKNSVGPREGCDI